MDTETLSLQAYKQAMEAELSHLLQWWSTNTPDQQNGFFGEVDNFNRPILDAPKGLVLHSRILWTYAAAFSFQKDQAYLAIAKRAYDYLLTYFYDQQFDGFYWSLNADGTVLDGKKQIYGQAFAIYGLTEYYKATADDIALERAIDTFRAIEKYSFDNLNLGYIEALGRQWTALTDLRLSDKDLNSEKSMNTHLHVIEAYANLYQVWKNEELGIAIKKLLEVFKKYIISADGHLILFFTKDWKVQSRQVSFGHDIEAAWLLQECAEILGDEGEVSDFKSHALKLSNAVAKGVDYDGALLYEYDPDTNHYNREKHWWPQAEAMVGFFNAYQLTKLPIYLNFSIGSWLFVQQALKDEQNGEWYWGIDEKGSLMQENKAGFWKCPYHNTRACLEILKRV